MSLTLEMVVVGVAVAGAVAWAARAGYKSWKSQGVCSSCGSSGECPIANNPEALAELSQKGQLNHLDNCQPGGPTCQDLAEALEREPLSQPPETRIT
jgi:hypothetical protein